MRGALLLSCLVLVSAHVRMYYTGISIRSAKTSVADSPASVSGPCGCNTSAVSWGANGITQLREGDRATLAIGYAAGHASPANKFQLGIMCGNLSGSHDPLKGASSPMWKAKLLSVPSWYNASEANVSVKYYFNFTVPAPKNMTNGNFCTISAQDQRDWGGCVDVQILPPATPSPTLRPTPPTRPPSPAPTPAPTFPLAGLSFSGPFPVARAQCNVDVKFPDNTYCCCLTGRFVATHATGANTGSVALQLDPNPSCLTNSSASSREFAGFSGTVELIADPVLPVLRGCVEIDNVTHQNFDLALLNGVLTMTSTSNNAYICSVQADELLAAAGSSSGGAVAAAVLVPLIAIGGVVGAVFFVKSKKGVTL